MADLEATSKAEDLTFFFGHPDATFDKGKMKPFFLPNRTLLDSLKYGARGAGKFIVVGQKGSGKTALARYLAETTKSKLVWNLNVREPFFSRSVGQLGAYESEIELVLVNLILSSLANLVMARKSDFSEAATKNLERNLHVSLAEHFQKVLKASKVKTRFFELDLDLVLKAEKTAFVDYGADKYAESLGLCFSEKPGLILLDDIDDLFLGAEQEGYGRFVEGLCRAARTINTVFEERIHFLIFLKYGVFRLFFDSPKDYDKLRPFITLLEWDRQGLEDALRKRVRTRFPKYTGDDPLEAVMPNHRPEEVKEVLDFFIRLCAGGPRDVIDLGNRAIELAGEPVLRPENLAKAEEGFSRERLNLLHSEYGFRYPRIQELVEMCFSGRPAEWTRANLLKFLEIDVLGNGRTSRAFDKVEYFLTATPERLLKHLFSVGFLGYTVGGAADPVFVLRDPNGSALGKATRFVVHPAYRHTLGCT